jgi:ABC-2 type transport system permease protein
MKRVTVLLRKEWLELRQDRLILLGTFGPAVLLTLLPLLGLYAVRRAPDGAPQDDNILTAANPALLGMTGREFGQAILGLQLSVLFFMLPLIIPSVIAAYSIVGEKAGRTLEPLLASPIRIWQLLLGKSLAALIPSVGVTWLLGGVFVVGVNRLAVSPRVVDAIISPGWVIVLTLCTPLLALVTIALMVAVSARVNDPRTAQQISGILVLPVVTVVVGQVSGRLVLSPALALAATVVLALVATTALWGATRIFQREVILTRWR